MCFCASPNVFSHVQEFISMCTLVSQRVREHPGAHTRMCTSMLVCVQELTQAQHMLPKGPAPSSHLFTCQSARDCAHTCAPPSLSPPRRVNGLQKQQELLEQKHAELVAQYRLHHGRAPPWA